jgi:signal transduction histidine kinase/FixJ family two-component response regulator
MNRPLRVLQIEDSVDDALLLLRELRRGGFAPVCERVETAETMTSALADREWDLVISDYSMPYFSGLAALELLKKSGLDIPFIVVSGTIGEDLAVAAMKAGAHDYMMKGNLQRLAPSIERELREAESRRQRNRAEDAARRNLERIKILHEIDLAITSTLELEAVLNLLLEKIDLVLPYSATTVRLFNKETRELEPVACRNINETEWKAINAKESEDLSKIILENQICLTTSNVQTDPRSTAPEFARKEGLVSYVGVPLIAKDETLGLVGFYTKQRHSFDDDEIEFLTTLAGQAAIAIHNARLYEQIKKQIDEINKSNKVKDEFLSVVSHELRTPLNVSMGYAALLKDGSLGEINGAQEKALEKVISHSTDLLKMVNSILYATSLEAEVVGVNSARVALADVLDELKSEYTISFDKELTVLWDFSDDMPVVKTDRAKLKNILDNLVDNAIKFTEKGRVAVRTRYISQSNSVEFEISDTGVGIPKEKLPIIFEMFRQVDGSETRPYGGVGLGLFIAKKFAEMLGGNIDVQSEPDNGSTFTVTLPAGNYENCAGEIHDR